MAQTIVYAAYDGKEAYFVYAYDVANPLDMGSGYMLTRMFAPTDFVEHYLKYFSDGFCVTTELHTLATKMEAAKAVRYTKGAITADFVRSTLNIESYEAFFNTFFTRYYS